MSSDSNLSDSHSIRIEGLSKCYQIYAQPRDRLKQFVMPRLRRAAALAPRQYFREFWALQDFSLTVKRGETVGIIGRNGSGKSTLLQLVCGTLTPTSGSIDVDGRVAALLELGAGFNPEFTGRENVVLNAAVLGIDASTMETKFEQIASFADIGPFIDQPVKTYSSGMLVRLAFAVAIHVEPKVLIVDEALSVGDFAFQNKCVQRLRKMRDDGVTLLFVSHDLNAVQTICDHVVWLEHGKVVMSGNPVDVCQEYQVAMLGSEAPASGEVSDFISQQNTGMAHFVDLRIAEMQGGGDRIFRLGDAIRFKFTLEADAPLDDIVFTISIYRADGDWVIGQTSREAGVVWDGVQPGQRVTGRLRLEPLCLVPGDYVAAFSACSVDLAICYALTDLHLRFSVRSPHPTWGRFAHPATWTQ
jgi:ABC-type polysaccharide/polyol phosphate transport system ATPase subunit